MTDCAGKNACAVHSLDPRHRPSSHPAHRTPIHSGPLRLTAGPTSAAAAAPRLPSRKLLKRVPTPHRVAKPSWLSLIDRDHGQLFFSLWPLRTALCRVCRCDERTTWMKEWLNAFLCSLARFMPYDRRLSLPNPQRQEPSPTVRRVNHPLVIERCLHEEVPASMGATNEYGVCQYSSHFTQVNDVP